MQGLMRSFVGQRAFSGSWEEELDIIIGTYKTRAAMCEVTDHDKLRAIAVILSGDALIYYSTHIKQCKTYNGTIDALWVWYSKSDKRQRILIKWQSMRFIEELGGYMTDWEVEVFRTVVAT